MIDYPPFTGENGSYPSRRQKFGARRKFAGENICIPVEPELVFQVAPEEPG